jgi:hypothetical protein
MNKISNLRFAVLGLTFASTLLASPLARAEDGSCSMSKMFAESNFRMADENYTKGVAEIDRKLVENRDALTARFRKTYPAWKGASNLFFQKLAETDGRRDPQITDRAVVEVMNQGAVQPEAVIGYFTQRARDVEKMFPDNARVHLLNNLDLSNRPQFQICVDQGNDTGCAVVSHEAKSSPSETLFVQEQFANERRNRIINSGLPSRRPRREDFAVNCESTELPAQASTNQKAKQGESPLVALGDDAGSNSKSAK